MKCTFPSKVRDGEFMMTENEMSVELKENNITDNPFDSMLHHAMELTRELLFACHRLRNNEIPEQFWTSEEKLGQLTDKINEEFSKLQNITDETVSMCRETSFYYQPKEFERLNDELLKSERCMDTVWTRCNPNRNDRFERIRLGKDSKQYERLIELREISENAEEFMCLERRDLNDLCDVILRPDKCIEYGWETKEKLEEKKKIIEKYHLTEEDVEYIIAYRKYE